MLENMFPGTGQNNSATKEQVTVVVAAIIDEEGNVRELQIDSPSLPEFNMAALEVLRRSPKWNPAVSHNRKVCYWIKQPITFVYPANN